MVRFNISVNDALNSERYGGIWIRADGRPMTGIKVYNNTVFTTTAPAAWIQSTGVEVDLRNNILITSSNGIPMQVDDATNDPPSLRIANNLFWRSGGPFVVRWNGTDFNSIMQFQQAFAKFPSDKKLGVFSDPEINLSQPRSQTVPLTNFSQLGALRHGDKTAWTSGLASNGIESVAGPLKDFLGVPLTNRRELPLGAISGLVTP